MQAIKACMLADAELTAKGLCRPDRVRKHSAVWRASAHGAHTTL